MNDRPKDQKCAANKTDGTGPCNNAAGKGTDHVGFGHCSKHSGSTPNGVKHAAKEEAAWRQRIADEVDPSISKVVSLRDSAKGE